MVLDVLVKMALVHYQFEAIHPFPDGNGRTGRILNILYLVDRGLLNLPVLYLSRYVIDHKAAYYEGLRRVTEEGAWADWVLYMLPDGHFKFPHLWPPKLLQAGRPNYRCLGWCGSGHLA